MGICIILGTAIGYLFPGFSRYLGNMEVESIPVALVLLVMMYPIMLKINFKEILNVKKNSRPFSP